MTTKRLTPKQVKEKNYARVLHYLMVLNLAGCNCEPHADVKTYDLWQRDGMQVQRGQISIKLDHMPALFCRCQVKPRSVRDTDSPPTSFKDRTSN